MILEVLETRTGSVRTRLKLDGAAVSLGRGYSNDLILDDPYVDARHARLSLDDSGALILEDLGSLNGLNVLDTPTPVTRIAVRAGLEVRVGRTTLRFRDPGEPVPAALADQPDRTRSKSLLTRGLATLWLRIALPVVATGTVSGYTWLQSFEASSGSDAFSGGVAFLTLAALWAGIWAIASRIVVHQFRFFEHLALTSAVTLISLVLVVAAEWLAFLFPDNPVSEPLSGLFLLVLIAAVIASHLAFSSTMTHGRRWRAGAVTSGVLVVLGIVAALAERETFSDIPQFSSVLKPFGAEWVPTRSIEDLSEVAVELKKQVDEISTRD